MNRRYNDSDEKYMKRALMLAEKAYERDEVPVGALIVIHGRIISEAYNMREKTYDPTGHAEIIAIKKASARIKNWRLNESTLYITKEPCIMCCGAIVNARIKKVVYGCNDEKGGGARSLYTLLNDSRLNHRVDVVSGVCGNECADMLRRFFQRKRG